MPETGVRIPVAVWPWIPSDLSGTRQIAVPDVSIRLVTAVMFGRGIKGVHGLPRRAGRMHRAVSRLLRRGE